MVLETNCLEWISIKGIAWKCYFAATKGELKYFECWAIIIQEVRHVNLRGFSIIFLSWYHHIFGTCAGKGSINKEIKLLILNIRMGI